MKYYLLTTTQCPRCPAVKEFVQQEIPFPGEILDETSADFHNTLEKFGVSVAPTLIVLGDQNEEIFRGNEVSEIRDFLNSDQCK